MKEILLKNGTVGLVDDEDFELVRQYKWFASKTKYTIYLKAVIDGKRIYLHCFLFGTTGVDHENGNGLDNRRSNLRPCTQSQNLANSKPRMGREFKGVSKFRGQWRSCVVFDGRQYHLGIFSSEIKAAEKYDDAANYFWKYFARLNFPNRTPMEWKPPFSKLKTSKVVGVCFEPKRNKWRATLNKNGRQIFSARFSSETEAIDAIREVRMRHQDY
jgi:hypothetical protein